MSNKKFKRFDQTEFYRIEPHALLIAEHLLIKKATQFLIQRRLSVIVRYSKFQNCNVFQILGHVV